MASAQKAFGEFIIESLLGEGGMGKVYRARQVALDRWVALKVLSPTNDKEHFTERFYREARSAARLIHPNIIQIYTVGEHAGTPYFAMEYIDGVDLEQLFSVDAAPLDLEETIEIVRSVVKALGVGMEHGVVHRDIKPSNIMLAKNGLVKVMDFGLAKTVAGDPSVSSAGLVVGTPTYMSPEQGAGRTVDIRSDIYSLGCVLYECLCGSPPFSADNVAALIYKHAYEPPAAPRSKSASLPPEVEKLCLKMLAKSPADRFSSPGELLEALAQVPSNPTVGEMLLTRRIGLILSSRKPPAAKPSAAEGDAGAVAAPQAPATQKPSPPRTERVVLAGAAAPQPPVTAKVPTTGFSGGVAPPPTTRRVPLPALPPRVATPPPATSRVPLAKTPPPATSRVPLAEAPPPATSRVLLGAAPPLGAVTREQAEVTGEPAAGAEVAESRPRLPSEVFKHQFQKLPDGRWSYRSEYGQCSFAEGLAATIKPPPGPAPRNLGDCLLCANWNKRVGCAVAYCYELGARKSYQGLELLVEQALAWTVAGNFDRAIGLLGGYIKNNPEDPEGYRELARIYDRPDYKGREKRRAIVLYQRFAELAQASGKIAGFEISRALERANALNAMPQEKSTFIAPGAGVVFQCFYHGVDDCFSYGVLTAGQFVLARAGYIDPESGVTAAETGSAMLRATSVLRRFKSDKAKKAEMDRVREELSRLSGLTLDELTKDPACMLVASFGELGKCEMRVDQALGSRSILIAGKLTHQLVFLADSAFKGDQCYELLRRRLAKP